MAKDFEETLVTPEAEETSERDTESNEDNVTY